MEIKTILLLLAVTLSISALPQPDNLTPATTSANTNFQAAISNAKLGGKVQCAKCATEYPEIPTKLCEATMQKKSELDAQKGDKVVKADPGLVNPGGAANIGTE
ncbi:uncharacterized protein KY384_008656 [Bacidia gigantensis]|uniref:uncharacterized protein n=1 Tax=Bacidia gigantensis TaxID=2732470 RepID=UPI001D05788E|nr:uncharacterized protein KY384_008656 [Bacidia gigantensis]KAG8527226.1 hypothetical protein KY384_008656 [Bacidia gigantensis]